MQPPRLMDLVYRELHQMASRQMRRERGEHTLQTTALVHEAYIRCAERRRSSGTTGRISSRSWPNSCALSW